MKIRQLVCAIITGVATLFTSCEECEHEGDRSIASSLQVGDIVCSDGSVLSKEKKPFNGWKVKIDFEAKTLKGKPYHSEYWFILDKEAEIVVKSFEIPLL